MNEQGKGSRSALIRAWLVANPGPQASRDIAAGIGMAKDIRVDFAIGVMYRDGWLHRHGDARPFRYTLKRTESLHRPKRTHEQYLADRREAERARAQAKGRMSWDQYQQWLVEQREVKAKAKAEARQAAQAEGARLRKLTAEVAAANKARAKQQAQRQQEHAAQEKRDVARAVQAIKANAMAGARPDEDRPDTDAFIRDNPDKLIRLPPGEWSSPLRFTY